MCGAVGRASTLLDTASTSMVYTSLTTSCRYLDQVLHYYNEGRAVDVLAVRATGYAHVAPHHRVLLLHAGCNSRLRRLNHLMQALLQVIHHRLPTALNIEVPG